MKKVLMLLAVLLTAISCEKEGDIELTKSDVVGRWNVTKITEDGETTELQSGAIVVNLSNDNSYRVNFLGDSYIGTYTIEGNTVTGVTLDPITEYFEFMSLSGNKAKINYKNSVGDSYKFEAEKN